MQFVARHRHSIFTIGCLMIVFGATMLVTGCSAPTFLTDLEAVIPTISFGLGGILTLIGGLTKNPAYATAATEIEAVAQKVDDEVEQINELIAAYKKSPDDTTLANIEAGINEVVADLQPLLAPIGLPASETAIIVTTVKAFAQELESLLSIIPVLSGTTAGTTLTAAVVKPLPAKVFRANIKAALTAK